MDQERRRFIRTVLQDLRDQSKADLVTCHVRNPYAGYYWLLDKIGNFRYPHPLSGPLTLPKNIDRMEFRHRHHAKYDYFSVIPIELSRNILSGASFATREGIVSSIRICVSDGNVLEPKPLAVIFLSYRDQTTLPTEDEVRPLIERRYPLLSEILTAVPYQPHPSPDEAFRLRSVMHALEGVTAQLLQSGSDQLDQIYAQITKRTFELVRPDHGKNVVCTLSDVDATSSVNIIGWHGPKNKPQAHERGIVDHVGRTGQFYLVNNLPEYSALTPDPYRPPYVEYDRSSRSEIACPLIVQDKVIGVLNLEADVVDAYSDEQMQLLHRMSGFAAVAMSQVTLWKDLARAITVPKIQLLAEDREAILQAAVDAVAAIGYKAAILDLQTRKWTGGETWNEVPRENGYTVIAASGAPVALVDLRIEGGTPTGRYIRGRVDDKKLFVGWNGESEELPASLSEATGKYVMEMLRDAAPGEVVTDVALPIFERDDVQAVMWFTSRRHFMSVLD